MPPVTQPLISKQPLSSAKTILTTNKLPNIAYHLATLALEEIGKAGFFAVYGIPERREDAQEYFEKRFEDHYQKLHWAIWTPIITGREPITEKDFKDAQLMARVFHEKRQRGIYVNADLSDQSAPRDAISEEEAKRHIELVEARRALETARDWEGAGEPELERLRFFYSVAVPRSGSSPDLGFPDRRRRLVSRIGQRKTTTQSAVDKFQRKG